MSFVLSLSLSMSAVAKALISLIHDCIEWSFLFHKSTYQNDTDVTMSCNYEIYYVQV